MKNYLPNSNNKMNSFIYNPNSWCFDKHIIIYDIVLSSCKKKIYIITNSLLHVLEQKKAEYAKTNHKTNKYLGIIRKLLQYSDDKTFDSTRDITITVENNNVINCEWIEIKNYTHKHTIKVSLENEVTTKELNVNINLKTISKTIKCNFSQLYVQTGNLAAILLFKDENDFLDIWINYYKNLGVDTFFIYNNNPNNKKKYKELYDKYKTTIQFIDWGFTYQFPYGQAQLACYNQALNLLRNRFNWILYIDIDEYAVFNNDKISNYTQLINNFDKTKIATVSYKCMWFGCSHGVKYDPSNFLEKLIYTSGEPVTKLEKHKLNCVNSKCLHNPLLTDIAGIHVAFKYTGEHLQLDAKILRFNHYFTLTDWGKDRFFTKDWEKDHSKQYKKKCKCDILCKIKNTELIDKYVLK